MAKWKPSSDEVEVHEEGSARLLEDASAQLGRQDHQLHCRACGNELRSSAEQRCHHCGALNPLEAEPEYAHKNVAGDPTVVPRTIAGATADDLRRFLSTSTGGRARRGEE